jgi:hypothetical protein
MNMKQNIDPASMSGDILSLSLPANSSVDEIKLWSFTTNP